MSQLLGVKSIFSLKRHIALCHISLIEEEKQYVKCEFCGKGFKLPTDLDRHIALVHGTRKRKTTILEKVLKNKDKDCDQCESSFAKTGDLNRHIRIVHEGSRVTCNICDQTFTRLENLEKHILKIHDETETERKVKNIKVEDFDPAADPLSVKASIDIKEEPL